MHLDGFQQCVNAFILTKFDRFLKNEMKFDASLYLDKWSFNVVVH